MAKCLVTSKAFATIQCSAYPFWSVFSSYRLSICALEQRKDRFFGYFAPSFGVDGGKKLLVVGRSVGRPSFIHRHHSRLT